MENIKSYTKAQVAYARIVLGTALVYHLKNRGPGAAKTPLESRDLGLKITEQLHDMRGLLAEGAHKTCSLVFSTDYGRGTRRAPSHEHYYSTGYKSPLAPDGVPFIRSEEEVLALINASECGRGAQKRGHRCYPTLAELVTDIPSFVTWCRDALASACPDGVGRQCTRWPKDDSLKEELQGRTVRATVLMNRVIPAYLLFYWDAYQEGKLFDYLCKHEDGWRAVDTLLDIVGDITAPPEQKRKVGAADVAAYINNFLTALRKYPLACSLMVAGLQPDDPLVLQVVNPHFNPGDTIHDYCSSRFTSGWLDNMVESIYSEKRGGKPFTRPIWPALGLALRVEDFLAQQDKPLLGCTKELAARLHALVTDPSNDMAMTMSLAFPNRYFNDGGAWHCGEEFHHLGQIALTVTGHAESEAIARTIQNRIKKSVQDA